MRLRRLFTTLGVLLIVLATVGLTGCKSGPKYRIGVSQCSSDDWRNKMNDEILREAMFDQDVEVEIRSADDSSAKQIEDLDYFVKNNFDAIIVSPNEANALTPKIEEIYKSGMPIVLFDRSINTDSYTAFQGADNEAIGAMAAEVTRNLVAQPKVIEIKGLMGSTPAEYRNKGFVAKADSLGIEIVASEYGDWNNEKAAKVFEKMLAEHPEANIVYAHNDRMAIAAKEVALKHNRPDIKIIGVDAAPEIGVAAVEEGKIDATFIYPTAGDKVIQLAVNILENKPYDKENILPSPSSVDASNAKMLQMQNNLLKEETAKILTLESRMDSFTQRINTQKYIMYGIGVIVILLALVLFLLMRTFNTNRLHHQEMAKRNEELSRQRDELDELYRQLQEAAASKLTFFTNVSHDLRTPLTLISDPVHRIAESGNLSEDERILMQLADKNVKRLQRLVNQILDIRKYDSGQLKLNLVNVNVTQAIQELAKPFANMAKKNHIKFNVNILHNEDIVTAVDTDKAERIVFNLLSNAFKFTPENGSITLSLDREGDWMLLKVADTGCGIPAEEINHIFERFFKTDHINPNGSGIGLALSKVFVDMHGGEISVESHEGKGTTFTVKLPIRRVEGEEIIATPDIDVSEIDEVVETEVSVSEDTPTVLVIDDNRDICTLVKSIMTDSYTVLVAQNGAQGIRLASKYIPDLVICDVMMPGMDGYEVCRKLKDEQITSHIPVLLLTACSRDEQRREGYECGADGYMSKPFEAEMLLTRIKSLIDNRSRIYKTLDTRQETGEGKPKPVEGAVSSIDDEFYIRFVQKIEENIANSDISVESLAADLGLSRVQLYRKIKAVTNYSAAEMIRIIRLKRGATMLKSSDITVSEVAYSVGFSSPSYFSRCYKEYFGESPIETQSRTSKSK